MKNQTKLIFANVFALFSVAIIAIGMKLFGLEIGFSAGSILTTSLLILVPQFGFMYFYFTSKKLETRKVVA
ncbi:hypothetical protein P872_07355 [Rhodonellum psychrophilum GCM71 = DSM 17998]|uniref:Uncharacterized protein n=2 Tax=Rhodonellum TaxID=336827 RepID=U5BZV8_9BACT|nr:MULTISPECIES: hypothetical protein [Rhodonellum]ERM82216.1 hypothetical protein P872_07355 [Rhodonellum psychrophilum GCM71 = DSM 17998]MDO9551529.1 hypothetical protein [Rhodonellum sp.]SDZ40889.1 hypothetical protein SAMN05444412_11374 [Rhodonellum ikkaensis]